jgi:hypothetical protein
VTAPPGTPTGIQDAQPVLPDGSGPDDQLPFSSRVDDPGRQRAGARRAFRPRRAVPATIVATLLAAAAVLTAIGVIARLVHRDAGLPEGWLAHLSRTLHWDDRLALAIAAAACLLGLILLIFALRPGRGPFVAIHSAAANTVTGISRASLRRYLSAAVLGVDGIDRAQVRLRRRSVQVTAYSPLRDAPDLPGQVTAAVTELLDGLAPLRPLRPRVSIRTRGVAV